MKIRPGRGFVIADWVVSRVIKLHPTVVDVLKVIKPLHVTEDSPVFLNHDGEPVDFHTWRAKIWYRALRGQGDPGSKALHECVTRLFLSGSPTASR